MLRLYMILMGLGFKLKGGKTKDLWTMKQCQVEALRSCKGKLQKWRE